MNQEHYDILMEGVDVWNRWRAKNSGIKPDLDKVDFSGTDLREADLSIANIREANLSKAILKRVDLTRADLTGADLTGADLTGADLSRANLSGANLIKVAFIVTNLYKANLHKANLYKANLSGANFQQANLFGAGLIQAVLYEANLNEVNLSEADLSEANLIGASFIGANLSGTDFEYSQMQNTILDFSNLTKCKNLLKVSHAGPSTIGLNTFIRSRGEIPDEFLLGAGYNKWQIKTAKLHKPNLSPNQITDLVYKIDELRNSSPLQIHNLFISYTHDDSSFVTHLETYLRKKDVSFWRDVHHATAGPLESVVVRAMDHNPTVLLILSKAAIQSDWVEFEITKARELGKKLKRPVLCPIALDDSWKDKEYWKECQRPERLINWIQEYNILDFSDWQNDPDFETKFNRLLKGLNLFYKK